MDEKKKKELAIRSSAAEYLTFVASTGESDASYEMRYEDENIWLTQKMMADFPAHQTHLFGWGTYAGGNCQEILDSSNGGQPSD